MTNTLRTIDVDAASDPERRMWEHNTHALGSATAQYDLTKLVSIVECSPTDDAIAWENALKPKTRAKKPRLMAVDWAATSDIAHRIDRTAK